MIQTFLCAPKLFENHGNHESMFKMQFQFQIYNAQMKQRTNKTRPV